MSDLSEEEILSIKWAAASFNSGKPPNISRTSLITTTLFLGGADTVGAIMAAVLVLTSVTPSARRYALHVLGYDTFPGGTKEGPSRD